METVPLGQRSSSHLFRPATTTRIKHNGEKRTFSCRVDPAVAADGQLFALEDDGAPSLGPVVVS